jgi:ATP-dependent RNA helicase DDX49/DBP8
LRFLVLDEADRMLDAGFGDEMKNICAILPKTYQLLLFSATMSSEMEERARQVTGRADVRFTRFGTAAKATVPASLTQSYLFMPPHVKLTYLVYLMKTFGDRSCIVFVDRCRTAELLRAVLKELGVFAVSLHSQLPQESRSRALTAFRSAVVSCLIATDVASRGLDIPQVEYVISYDLPLLPQTYLHRVGRAGRAGRPGHAIALLSPRDIPRLHEIEETIGVKLAEHAAKEEDIMQYLSPTAVAEKLAQQSLVDTNFGELRRSRKRRADQAET